MWTKWLHNPSFSSVRNTQCGDKMTTGYPTAVSGPKCGQSGSITPTLLGVPIAHR